MESKSYIKRDDPEHLKFKPIRLQATVARNIPLEDTRPSFATENNKFLGRQQRIKDKFTKNPYNSWKNSMPSLHGRRSLAPKVTRTLDNSSREASSYTLPSNFKSSKSNLRYAADRSNESIEDASSI